MHNDGTPRVLLWLRSLVFWLFFPLTVLVYATLLLVLFPLSHRQRASLVRSWARLVLWWLKLTCRLDYEVQGLEHVGDGAAIAMAKHQSTWETIALQLMLPRQVWVAKRELLWIPMFGWGLAMMKTIAIKRGTGRAAIAQLVRQGTERLNEGIWVVIFPEGTRIAAGQKGRYRIGGAALAEQSGYPIVPIAHNAGEYWPRRSFLKRPGTIQVRIGPPISSQGRTAQELLGETEQWIEQRMAEITTVTR